MAYSQFHDGFWTDPEIRGLSSDDKLILVWFITNPYRHYSGVYFFEFDSISKQTGLPEKTVRKGIDTLLEQKFIKYNPKFSMVWVIKMARHEVVRGEKSGEYSLRQTKGIANHLETLHKCPLIRDFLSFYEDMNIPYLYPIRQEEEETEAKTKEEIIALPKKDNGSALPFFSCKFFDVSPDYRQKLKTEYPLLTNDMLRCELSKMEDWVSDNQKKKKFMANGNLANPKLFIKNWLGRVIVSPPAASDNMDAYLDYLGERDGVTK